MAGAVGPGAVDGVDDPDLVALEPGRVVERLLGKPAGLGQDPAEMNLEKGVDRHVGLGHGRAAGLGPGPRRGLLARTKELGRDRAGVARGVAHEGQERADEVLRRHEAGRLEVKGTGQTTLPRAIAQVFVEHPRQNALESGA
jgi:hypothetical protein